MMIITCENIVKIYSQTGVDVVALQGLDLTVSKGEMLGIVGESGSGKSTLLNVLGGLDRPSAGKVWVDGSDLFKLSDRELDDYRCKQVGFLWQQTTRNLIPYLNAFENIELPMRLTKRSPIQRWARAGELLEMVGLEKRMKHLPGHLSGGEQQRVAIAVALANSPSLLLADEPTGELDTTTAQVIYTMLQKINREIGTTVIIVSHDSGISQHVGRVVAIRDGKTSTETVRVENSTIHEMDIVFSSEKKQGAFEELLMLDSAGRVQIPREVLENLGIGGRVRLEVKENRVILSSVVGHRLPKPSPELEHEEGNIFIEEEPLPEPKKRRIWSSLFLGKKEGSK